MLTHCFLGGQYRNVRHLSLLAMQPADRWIQLMVDTFDVATRSALMARIRSSGTKPEELVHRLARRLRRSFATHPKRLPGRPDLAFFKLKRAVFVHGCFWHQHQSCSRSNIPKSKVDYWGPKLEGNVLRDRRAVRALRRLGWDVLVVWECECKSPDRVSKKLSRFLATPPSQLSGSRPRQSSARSRPTDRRSTPRLPR